MKTIDTSKEGAIGATAPREGKEGVAGGTVNGDGRARLYGVLTYAGVMGAVFIRPLVSLAAQAAGSELNSYILLAPFISAYLLFLQRKRLPARHESAPGWACIPGAVGVAAVALNWHWRGSLGEDDSLSLMALAFVFSLAAGGFLFLGRRWMAAAAFPVGFLIFMVPLPDAAAQWLETGCKLASTEAAAQFFEIAGVPALRDGTVFQLPDISIRVAQECSGIHSSLVLVIASVLASYLILRSPWRRALLVVFAIPLGIIRNGFRILVLGWLCVHIGPQMIDSPIHHKGGPIFFVLSLAPLFLVLWGLCRGERGSGVREGVG